MIRARVTFGEIPERFPYNLGSRIPERSGLCLEKDGSRPRKVIQVSVRFGGFDAWRRYFQTSFFSEAHYSSRRALFLATCMPIVLLLVLAVLFIRHFSAEPSSAQLASCWVESIGGRDCAGRMVAFSLLLAFLLAVLSFQLLLRRSLLKIYLYVLDRGEPFPVIDSRGPVGDVHFFAVRILHPVVGERIAEYMSTAGAFDLAIDSPMDVERLRAGNVDEIRKSLRDCAHDEQAENVAEDVWPLVRVAVDRLLYFPRWKDYETGGLRMAANVDPPTRTSRNQLHFALKMHAPQLAAYFLLFSAALTCAALIPSATNQYVLCLGGAALLWMVCSISLHRHQRTELFAWSIRWTKSPYGCCPLYYYDTEDPRRCWWEELASNDLRVRIEEFGIDSSKLFELACAVLICVKVRWDVAKAVLGEMKSSLPTSGADAVRILEKYTKMYANHMRHDGSGAFRLAYEWLQARVGLYEAAAECATAVLEEKPDLRQTTKFGASVLNELHSALRRDWLKYCESYTPASPLTDEAKEAALSKLRRALAIKKHGNHDEFSDLRNFSLESLNCEIRRYLSDALSILRENAVSKNQIKVGTLTFGMVQPSEFARSKSAYPVLDVLKTVRSYYDESYSLLIKATDGWEGHPDFGQQFFPLVGDYSFLHYMQNKTPIEKDCHAPNSPKLLVKQRLVLQVLGGNGHAISDPPDGYRLGRVVQIRFRYRWEWMALAKRLKEPEHARYNPTLFLSSGWEDAVLILWYRDEEDWIRVSEVLQLEHGSGFDMHSNAILPSDILDNTASLSSLPETLGPVSVNRDDGDSATLRETNWQAMVKSGDAVLLSAGEYLANMKATRYVGQRTGRYDLTVAWTRPDSESTEFAMTDYWAIYISLPRTFWKAIGAVTTSVEKRLKSKPQGAETTNGLVIVSHFLLKH